MSDIGYCDLPLCWQRTDGPDQHAHLRAESNCSHSISPAPSCTSHIQIISVNCSLPVRGSLVRVRRWGPPRPSHDQTQVLEAPPGPPEAFRIAQISPAYAQWGISSSPVDGGTALSVSDVLGGREVTASVYAVYPLLGPPPVQRRGRRKRRRGREIGGGTEMEDRTTGDDVLVTLRNWNGEEVSVPWPRIFRLPSPGVCLEEALPASTCSLLTLQKHIPFLCLGGGGSGADHVSGPALKTSDDVDRVLHTHQVTQTPVTSEIRPSVSGDVAAAGEGGEGSPKRARVSSSLGLEGTDSVPAPQTHPVPEERSELGEVGVLRGGEVGKEVCVSEGRGEEGSVGDEEDMLDLDLDSGMGALDQMLLDLEEGGGREDEDRGEEGSALRNLAWQGLLTDDNDRWEQRRQK